MIKDIENAKKEIIELDQELDNLNNKIEEQGEQLIQYKSNYTEEKNKNIDLEKKIKELNAKLSSDEAISQQNTEVKEQEIESSRARTYKVPSRTEMEEEEIEKYSRRKKYSFRFKENKEINDSVKISGGALTMNTTSGTYKQKENKDKKSENENMNEDIEFTPDNYNIVKVIKLNKSNLKWFLFKKIKKKQEKQLKIKTYSNRRFRFYSHKKEEENNIKEENDINNSVDSFSNYCWKPQKNRKDFIDFVNTPLDDSLDKQKKIEELETKNKELEEKLNKKEKDLNRLNVNYAKILKNSKNSENTEEKMVEKLEKLREENKKLNATVNKLKSEQQFIGLSFIADDLEAEQFIEDKCFEDILDNLVGKNKEKNNSKEKEKDKEDNKIEAKFKTEKNTIDNQKGRYLNTRKYYKSKRKNE